MFVLIHEDKTWGQSFLTGYIPGKKGGGVTRELSPHCVYSCRDIAEVALDNYQWISKNSGKPATPFKLREVKLELV